MPDRTVEGLKFQRTDLERGPCLGQVEVYMYTARFQGRLIGEFFRRPMFSDTQDLCGWVSNDTSRDPEISFETWKNRVTALALILSLDREGETIEDTFDDVSPEQLIADQADVARSLERM